MSYQCGTWLPWWFKRYVLWRKGAQLEPLYTFDEGFKSEGGEVKKGETKGVKHGRRHEDEEVGSE